MKRLIVGLLASILLGAVFVQPARTFAAQSCAFVNQAQGAISVQQGQPVPLTVSAACPGAVTITLAVHVNGAAYNYTLAETVSGPETVQVFQLPTSMLPVGVYTGFVEANGQRGLADFRFQVTPRTFALASEGPTVPGPGPFDCEYYYGPTEYHFTYYGPINATLSAYLWSVGTSCTHI